MKTDVKAFYDNYGIKEWNRHDQDVPSYINYLLHLDFIKNDLIIPHSILDVGCGMGRFSAEFAKLGNTVTLFDLSDTQLELAKEKLDQLELDHMISGYHQGDMSDLSRFDDASFDMLVCYGAPLNYILKNHEQVLLEFNRVLKPGGKLYTSVVNRWGVLKMVLGKNIPTFFSKPDYWDIYKVMETGDLPVHPEVAHPPRHLFESTEMSALLESTGFTDINHGGSPTFTNGSYQSLTELQDDEQALKTILDIELRLYQKPSVVDQGEFLLSKATKK
jgi:SAM-dependent methyltransferase